MSGRVIIGGVVAVLAVGALGVSQNPELREKVPFIGGDETPTDPNTAAALGQTAVSPDICPMNGVQYPEGAHAYWENERPVIVMVNNHPDARPQSGLTTADEVVEAPTEADITRLALVFQCALPAPNEYGQSEVGPVRSARQVFVSYASEIGTDPVYAHIGGSETDVKELSALDQINDFGWADYNDIDGRLVGQFNGKPVFYKEPNRVGREVASEHTWIVDAALLRALAKDRGLTQENDPWNEKFEPYARTAETPAGSRPASHNIPVNFSGNEQYNVIWQYDPASNSYLRFQAGQPHVDANNGKQVAPKNVVIMEVPTTKNASGNLTYHETVGKGNAILLQNGIASRVIWEKKDRESRTRFYNFEGDELPFVPGQIWKQVVGSLAEQVPIG